MTVWVGEDQHDWGAGGGGGGGGSPLIALCTTWVVHPLAITVVVALAGTWLKENHAL